MELPKVFNEPPNTFDESLIHRDLEENRDLWQHAAYLNQIIGVYGLKECDVTCINYYLTVVPEMDELLIDLVSRWKPGRVEWVNLESLEHLDLLVVEDLKTPPRILHITWII